MGLAQEFDGPEETVLNEWLNSRLPAGGSAQPTSSGSNKARARSKASGGARRMTLPDGTTLEEQPDGAMKVVDPSAASAGSGNLAAKFTGKNDWKDRYAGRLKQMRNESLAAKALRDLDSASEATFGSPGGMVTDEDRERAAVNAEIKRLLNPKAATPFTKYKSGDIQSLLHPSKKASTWTKEGQAAAALGGGIGALPFGSEAGTIAGAAKSLLTGGSVVLAAAAIGALADKIIQQRIDLEFSKQRARGGAMRGDASNLSELGLWGETYQRSRTDVMSGFAFNKRVAELSLQGENFESANRWSQLERARSRAAAGDNQIYKDELNRTRNATQVDMGGKAQMSMGFKRITLHGG